MLKNTLRVDLNTLDKVVLGGNMRRRSLLFSSGTSITVYVNIGAPALDSAGNGSGWVISTSQPTLVLRKDDMGDAIHEEVHAVGASGTPSLVITELFDN